MSVRVLVVDDSGLYRQLVKNVLRGVSDVEVVGVACSGSEALEKIAELKPDLLTLDVQMPDMNGLELLHAIKKHRLKVKAIMLSSLTAEGAQTTTDALLAGAFDFIQKPNSPNATTNRMQLETLLAEKISAFRESCDVALPRRSSASAPTVAVTPEKPVHQTTQARRIDAVLIGTSTGGPIALREILPKLPSSLGVPVLVVQHMPPRYTGTLAARIHEVSELPVCEATTGMPVEPNRIYIAPGGLQMGIESRDGRTVIRTSDDPPEHNIRPSVDYLFRSATRVYSGNLLAVILTGMGRDGTEGCRMIKGLGGYVLAQHPEGCIVYGMPKTIVEENLADRVGPLEKMASWIVRMVEGKR